VLDLRVKAPFFNYVISQRNHKGDLMSVSMSLMRSVHNESQNGMPLESRPDVEKL
jgi:hypothetical protein